MCLLYVFTESEANLENQIIEEKNVIQKFDEMDLNEKLEIVQKTEKEEIANYKIELDIGEKESEKLKLESKTDEEKLEEKKNEQKIDEETIKSKYHKESTSKLIKIVEEDENKPSPRKPTIEANKKLVHSRKSMLPMLKLTKNTLAKNVGACSNGPVESTEVTQLIDKMLKIAEEQKSTNIGMKDTETVKIVGRTERTVVRKHTTGGRASLLPSSGSSWQEKRRYSFTNRMSTVVKTTLNSPARKMIGSVNRLGTTTSTSMGMITSRSTTIGTSGSKVATKPRSKIDIGQENGNKKLGKKTEFSCKICKEKFHIKSLYEGHKRSHELMESQPSTMTSSLLSLTESVSTSSTNSAVRTNSALSTPSTRIMTGIPQCKYCDKKFALVRTLHIHLLQNCNKIPPSEKRKLQFTEMDHEEKAQLPKVFSSSALPSNAASVATGNSAHTHQVKAVAMKQSNNNILQKQHAEGLNIPAKRKFLLIILTLRFD